MIIFKLIRKIIFKLLTIKKETYFLMQVDVSDITKSKKLDNKFRVEEITLNNIGDYNFELFHSKLSKFEERLKNNSYKCYVILENKKVCYYTWISLQDFIMPRYVVLKKELKQDEALLLDSQCAKKYQGLGMHSFMNIYRLQLIKKIDKKKGLAIVLKGNLPAFKVQEKSGLKTISIMKTFYCKLLRINQVKFIDYEG
tara:strand:- start:4627 stop:5220 length:594 start_codon:yes stop_codon:yes gene_type:complete